MNKVLEEFSKIGIIPVIALDNVEDAAPLAKALCDGGLPCAEVTFRTAAAEESIRIMSEQFPEMLVGAGTVLTTEQVDRAVNAGAKFIVSPGLNPKVVKYCVEKGIPVTPGCSNPSDVEVAIELGLDVVKFFIISIKEPTNMELFPTFTFSPSKVANFADSAAATSSEALLTPTCNSLNPNMVETASFVKAVMPSQSFAAIMSLFTIQEPPHAMIFLKSR